MMIDIVSVSMMMMMASTCSVFVKKSALARYLRGAVMPINISLLNHPEWNVLSRSLKCATNDDSSQLLPDS